MYYRNKFPRYDMFRSYYTGYPIVLRLNFAGVFYDGNRSKNKSINVIEKM